MTISSGIRLFRDVSATAIPAGTSQILKKGTEVHITQELGGSLTIHADGLLFRIEGKDADALGRQVISSQKDDQKDHKGDFQTEMKGDLPLEDEVIWERLKTCFDPEIPVNIVDLGLVYDLKKRLIADGKYQVFVRMTLTATGCGMGEVIAKDARDKILSIPSVADAVVEIVWDPPWHQSMITEEGRLALGI